MKIVTIYLNQFSTYEIVVNKQVPKGIKDRDIIHVFILNSEFINGWTCAHHLDWCKSSYEKYIKELN